MALQFDLPGSEQWLMGNINAPVFGASTPEQFIARLASLQPDPVSKAADPAKVKAFADANPEVLLQGKYFASQPPKSTGRELFSASYVTALVRACRTANANCSDEDIVATATALTARSIADAYRRFMPEPVEEVLLSGGGANNVALVDMISAAIAPTKVRRFDESYFDGDAKEAVAFALLAKLFVDGSPANVPSATGARGPRILGKLTPAGNR